MKTPKWYREKQKQEAKDKRNLNLVKMLFSKYDLGLKPIGDGKHVIADLENEGVEKVYTCSSCGIYFSYEEYDDYEEFLERKYHETWDTNICNDCHELAERIRMEEFKRAAEYAFAQAKRDCESGKIEGVKI